MTDHTRCRSCGSQEVVTDPERCDFDDRPQVLALVCLDCGSAMRVAADHPGGDGCFWQAVTATCCRCSHVEWTVKPYGVTQRFDCERCGSPCRVAIQ